MSQKIKDAKKLLIKEGKIILLEGGYKELNIRKLVLKCGIGIGTFYNYFSNKDDLTTEIFKNDWFVIIQTINELKTSNLELKDKLLKIYLSIYDFVNNYSFIFNEIIFSGDSNLKKNKETIDMVYENVKELIEIEILKGTIRAPISSEKMGYMIIQNFFYMSRDKHLTFEEFYTCLNF